MRIYELAKERNITSKEVKSVLDDLGVSYKTHSSTIPEEAMAKVLKTLEKQGSDPKKKSAPKKKKATPKAADKKEVSATKAKEPVAEETPPAPIEPVEAHNPVEVESEQERLYENISEDVESEIEVYEEAFAEESGSRRKAAKPHGHKGSRDDTEDSQKNQEESGSPDEVISVWDGMTVKELSEAIKIPSSEILKKLFLYGVMASINKSLDHDTLVVVTDEAKVAVKFKEPVVEEIPETDLIAEDVLAPRPPVVTIMGHVNHGKTTLLDSLRQSRIVEEESGGITQHIGAYLIPHKDNFICFVDTPGHEAFTNMRAMGANVTDMVILVVAANESVQPQTMESINHAKEAEVPVIIAINKIDAPGANIDKVKSDLAEKGLAPEDWGGDYLCVPISALNGDGISELLDAVMLQSELLELKANPSGTPFGIVLESCKTDNVGPLVTVLVKNGTFKVGDPVSCGHVSGKIRRMENDIGQTVKEAFPSFPVRIFGFQDVPDSAARVRVYKTEKEARDHARGQAAARRDRHLNRKEMVTLDNLYSSIQAESKKDFKIVLKTDVVGSMTALNYMFTSIPSDKVALKVIHSGTGGITESDVMLAGAYGAVIFAYRTKIPGNILAIARQQHVVIKEYEVVYQVFEDITKAMEGMLDFDYVESATGQTEVKQLFKIGKMSVVAGCLVTSGKVTRGSFCRVRRGADLLPGEFKLASLKHYKNEVSEIKMGIECGIMLEDFNAFQTGDVLEFYVLEQTAQVL